MAKIASHQTSLKQLITKNRFFALVIILFIFICATAGIFLNPYFLIIAFLVLPFLSHLAKKEKILFSGQTGEKITAQILSALPEEYTVLNDIFIQNGNRAAQIDHVVLGPNGIFLFETKNHQGVIKGDEEKIYWTQKRSHSSEAKFYNPIKQVKSHAYVLRGLINNNSTYIFGNRFYARYLWVQPVVIFTNPEAKLSITTSNCVPVIFPREAIDLIVNYRSRFSLTQEQIERIAKILINCNKNHLSQSYNFN